MFYQIFLSPQVKRCVIIIYKHGLYGLLHELLNKLKFTKNYETPRHFRRWGGLCAHTRKKNYEILPHGSFAAGGAFVPTQEKKNYEISGNCQNPIK